MRKFIILIFLLGAFGLFAQIPTGTKSIGITASIGDILADDFFYSFDVSFGYFFMDNIEGLGGIGILGYTYEGADMRLEFYGGAYYHFPVSDVFGIFGGAMFGYWTWGDFNNMYIPIDAGIEYFLSENVAIKAFNRFQINFEEGYDNADYILVGTTVYFQ